MKFEAGVELEVPDGTTTEQVQSKLDELLVGLLREDMNTAYVLSKETSILQEPQFDKYLEQEQEQATSE